MLYLLVSRLLDPKGSQFVCDFSCQCVPVLPGPNPSCCPSLTASASLAQQPASVALGIASSWTFRWHEGGQEIPGKNFEAGIWRFPKIGLPLNHQFLDGILQYQQPFWVPPLYGNPHIQYWASNPVNHCPSTFLELKFSGQHTRLAPLPIAASAVAFQSYMTLNTWDTEAAASGPLQTLPAHITSTTTRNSTQSNSQIPG